MAARAQEPVASPAPVVAAAPLTLALTFDDLPAHGPLPPHMARPEVVQSILATLKAEKLPPVYGFVNGFRMEDYPYQIHILQAWHAAGQPLGNHTYSHNELDLSTAKDYIKDIAKNEKLLKRVDPDGDWKWFRYPFLEEGDTPEKRAAVMDWLKEHGYRIAEISMNFQDYKWNDAYGRCSAKRDVGGVQFLHDSYLQAADDYITVYRDLTQKIYGRDIPYILLLHVGSFDAKMLPELIALYRQRGFTFVTLEQASADPVYATEPAGAIKGGSAFQELVGQSRGLALPADLPVFAKVDAACQ